MKWGELTKNNINNNSTNTWMVAAASDKMTVVKTLPSGVFLYYSNKENLALYGNAWTIVTGGVIQRENEIRHVQRLTADT